MLVLLAAMCLAACSGGSSPAPTGAPTPGTAEGPVTATLVGAGDIAACDQGPVSATAAAATAALVAGVPGTVFTAGDDAYESGTPAQFSDCYDPTWGEFKVRTLLPSAGNHDFETSGGAGYFDYFGPRAGTPGEGWYSTDIGGWHVVVLNSNCVIVGCGPGSPQLTWLATDLAAHPVACTLAIWHHPLFSSGFHRDDSAVAPFWAVLSTAHADLVINGHDHDYERFAPQDQTGRFDPILGLREIVVGTGGAPLRAFGAVQPNREAADATSHGVIVLTLHTAGYDWRFVPVAGKTFTDSGSATCH